MDNKLQLNSTIIDINKSLKLIHPGNIDVYIVLFITDHYAVNKVKFINCKSNIKSSEIINILNEHIEYTLPKNKKRSNQIDLKPNNLNMICLLEDHAYILVREKREGEEYKDNFISYINFIFRDEPWNRSFFF